jgi:hypothetical protein
MGKSNTFNQWKTRNESGGKCKNDYARLESKEYGLESSK